jgi:hypothetical protein
MALIPDCKRVKIIVHLNEIILYGLVDHSWFIITFQRMWITKEDYHEFGHLLYIENVVITVIFIFIFK